MTADPRQWIGKTETRTDEIVPGPAARMAATLDRDDTDLRSGDPLPPLWHWLYFLPGDRQSDLGVEGHARLGDFLPPTSLPRRMWAGGRIEFRHPLRVGDAVTRASRILDVREKTGRSGPLMFVVVRHEVSNDGGIAIVEEHDIVYRDHPKADAPVPDSPAAPRDPEWSRRVDPGAALLFRYSALTFNAHRIHYDRTYATGTERYPGLVVHGPLIATLLVELLCSNDPSATLSRFRFRAVSPLFDTEPFWVCGRRNDGGRTVALWARGQSGRLGVEAEAVTAG